VTNWLLCVFQHVIRSVDGGVGSGMLMGSAGRAGSVCEHTAAELVDALPPVTLERRVEEFVDTVRCLLFKRRRLLTLT